MKNSSSYAQTLGLKILQAAVIAYGPIFTIEEVRSLLVAQDLSAKRTREMMNALTRGGWISRLKRGVYAVQSSLFAGEIHPFALADALVQPTAISHWSALAHHGLTTQIPLMVQASTPKRVVTPEMRHGAAYRPRGRAVWRVLDVEIEFISIKADHYFGFNQEWVGTWHRVKITDPERTCLDLIAHSHIFGGVQLALETIYSHISELDTEKLVQYTLNYKVGSVVKRMGWILDAIGVQEHILVPLREYPVQNYYALDPRKPRHGGSNSRWRIIENLPGGPVDVSG